jgi:putative heme-binding domain-containing protein
MLATFFSPSRKQQSYPPHYMKPLLIVTLTLALSLAARNGTTAELPVRQGLILELDAARQPGLHQSAGFPAIGNRSPLSRWMASPASLTSFAIQPTPAQRPRYLADGSEALVRFDGKDDFLILSGPKRATRELTVFVLAAPKGNPGPFVGLLAGAALGQNDYTSGFNLDFGNVATPQLSALNLETAGSPGFQNLIQPGKNLAAALPFGGFHVFTIRSKMGAHGNEVFLDGLKLADKPRGESILALDEITIGARFYSNDAAEPPFAQGMFQGDITLVALYDRALTNEERGQVEQSLMSRAAALNALAAGGNGHSLETLKDPPLVQMLVPGFAVEELPLSLRNLTGIRYRHDGRLVALGYDGRIHLSTDTDGDGREDRSTVFWDKSTLRGPIGMALLPANDPRGDGIFVASKGKVSLFLDKNRDGVADEEIVVASGWTEIAQNVDAVGLAVDPRDGSIYFGLGTENYANGYLIDRATGKSAFQLTTEHGTIQRVSADFSRRETFCTGVRFTCALAFNRHGDLFASEQEGATWLPNGNPFDELLHIQRGLHYGFPPRHPRHLPQVIDEPAVFEYGPQHQSTVGMVFNEGVNGGPNFGPARWAGDAFLCGESRGKLYRTQLVKTPAGYVAQNHLIGALGMLLVDTCVTPQGDLLLACHSGPPDWGSGPAGQGRIFRVRWVGKETPQPVYSWASAPDEFRIAFDRPLTDVDWKGAREKVRIEAGRFVSAGDRYEIMRPGYQVVRDQMSSPRRWVELQSLSLSGDRRTLVLRVPRQTQPETYAITLPLPRSWETSSPIRQRPEIDLALTLTGVQLTTESSEGTQKIMLPHPSVAVWREWTAGSADHEAFSHRLTSGTSDISWRMKGLINRANIFVPAVQPGASLDWDLAADPFANRMMIVRQDLSSAAPRELPLVKVAGTTWAAFELKGIGKPEGSGNGSGSETGSGIDYVLEDRVRSVPLSKLALPWASGSTSDSAVQAIARTDVKGNWLRGRRVFLSEGGCVTCHAIRGEGVAFGPDLSNLVHRDRESVLQDITRPSATINPDQAGSLVTLKSGSQIAGLIRSLTDSHLTLRLPGNVELDQARADVVSIEPLKTSLMPENLIQGLSEEQVEDLLTFLLTNPLEVTSITRLDPPMPRARAWKEVAPFLANGGAATVPRRPMRLLLCVDDKDHGIDEHDYPLWQQRWSKLLPLADGVKVRTHQGFPTAQQLSETDVAIFYSRNAGWSSNSAAILDDYQKRGGGLVYLHWAMEGRQDALAYAERIGIAMGAGSKYRHGDMELNFTAPEHPITRGFQSLKLVDETYWAFHGDENHLRVLARATEEASPRTQLWAYERHQGRVFGSIPGHYMWTFDDPLYRILVLRGIAWAAKDPDVDRLLELATIGARITPE